MSSEHDDREDDGAGTDEDVLVGGADDGQPRDRPQHRRRLTVALVAAAVLAAAGGGAYWAVAAGGDGKPAAAHPVTSKPAVAPPGQGSAGSGTISGSGGDYRLTGTLPKDGPTSAPLYRPDGGADKAAVGRLAALLGLTGPVVADHGSWRVGSADGTGPALLVGMTAPSTWSYARNGQVTPGARTVVPPAQPQVPPSAAASGTSSHEAAGSAATTGAGSPPVPAPQAEAVAAPVLAGLGLSGAQVDATRTVMATRTVAADPVVGGLPTHGWSTTLDIGPDGRITGGHGRLSALAKGDSYPVISAEQAYKDLSSRPIMRPQNLTSCWAPMPQGAQPAQPAQPGKGAGGTAASPTLPGQDKTLPHSQPCVAQHTPPIDITGARFGLALQFAGSGQALVPAWLFDAVTEGATAGSVIVQQAVEQADLPGPGASSGTGSGAPDGSHRSTVSGYQQHGSSLTLTFWGGVCETYRGSAAETADQVRVTVTGTVKDPGAICPALLRAQTTTVQLDGPLAGRTVVDATTGSPVKPS